VIDLFAYRAARAVGPIGFLHAFRHDHRRRIAEEWIRAGDIESAAGDLHARPGDDAALNGGCRSLRAVLHVDFDAETQR